MGDDTNLDEDMVSVNFGTDLFSVALRLAMKILVSIPVSTID
jgi:hypothetical protein